MKCSNVYYKDEMICSYKNKIKVIFRFLTIVSSILACFICSYIYKGMEYSNLIYRSLIVISFVSYFHYPLVINPKIEFLKVLSINIEDNTRFHKEIKMTYIDKVLYLVGATVFYIVIISLIRLFID